MESTWKESIYLWKQLWKTWDLRMTMLFSLFLQITLTFSAPWRKQMAKAYIVMPIWLAYLGSDSAANFAVRLMNGTQGEASVPSAEGDLLAFWAPFLLVHIGSPDTITAFALEDNELWQRHLFGLGVSVAFVFFLSFPNNLFWLPTLLMFVAGLIKLGERSWSLYLASSRSFRRSSLPKPDPGPNYAQFMGTYSSTKEAGLQPRIEMIPLLNRVSKAENGGDRNDLTDSEVAQHAYIFFETFKGLIADPMVGFLGHSQSRDFFLKRTPRDAFKVVEAELNFFYEILYTKAVVVKGMFGYPLRLISFSLYWTSLWAFYTRDKPGVQKLDIEITYALLLAAIANDVIAFLMVLFSDWTAVVLARFYRPCSVTKILTKFLNRHRWSESLSQYNLIHFCGHPLSERWEKIIGFFGLTDLLVEMKYVETVEFTNAIRDLIFQELKMKSEKVDDLETAKEIYSARGDWILRFEKCTELLPWIDEVDFDESLLLWHIATELCLNSDTNSEGGTAKNKDLRGLSKHLSDYMLYLLIIQSELISPVAGIGQKRFRDTCAEAKRFFRRRNIGKVQEEKTCCLNIFAVGKCFCGNKSGKGTTHSCMDIFCCCLKKCFSKAETGPDEVHKQACKSILAVNTTVEPAAVKGDRCKSVLFDACILAKELEKLGEERKWEIMNKVWVELLSYAACRCRAKDHAAQLSKGGQLITLVWLLMAHLGLGNQFQISEGHEGAKLIVGK